MMGAGQQMPVDADGDIVELDSTDKIQRFQPSEFGPDELYDLRREISAFERDAPLRVRVDIEYENSLQYDDYYPKFTTNEVISMAMHLASVHQHHIMHGNRTRADRTEELVKTLSTRFQQWAEFHGVDPSRFLGIDVGGDRPSGAGRHDDRLDRAEMDYEDVDVEVEEGSLKDILPDAIEEKEMSPHPPEPDSPDEPGPGGGDDGLGGA